MSDPYELPLFHMVHIERLESVLHDGHLLSDKQLQDRAGAEGDTGIGYDHIKVRRLSEIHVKCCGNRFVGEFVPFYFCPRSPMLYVVNQGRTGYPRGCQTHIVHLVTSVRHALELGQPWAFSDGNAGALHATFSADLGGLGRLDWDAIRAIDWRGRTHQKSAEFLVADRFPWTAIEAIGCHNDGTASAVERLLRQEIHRPPIEVKPAGYNADAWYYA